MNSNPCPKCGASLIIQPSVSPDFQKAICIAKVSKKRGQQMLEVNCGYEEFRKKAVETGAVLCG